MIDSLEQKLSEFFKLKQFSDVLPLLNEERNQSVVENNALNLVSLVCSEIKSQKGILSEPNDWKTCSDVLELFADKGNPKEVLLSLLEAADCINEDEFFELLLMPLQKTLLKVPGKRGASLEDVLGVLNAHFQTIPWPEDQNLEGEELMLLDLDKNVQRTSHILAEYVCFLKPFIEEVSYGSEINVQIQVMNQRSILQKYLLSLLCRPLLYHDLHFISDRQISSIQASCLKVLEYLAKISKDIFNLHKLNFKDSLDEDFANDLNCDDVFDLAFGNLAYLMFAESLLPESRPQVYAPGYLFECNLSLMIAMLSRKEYLVLYKALHLCKALLDFDFELFTVNLSFSTFVKLSMALTNIAVYCPVENYRCLAATLFMAYVRKFHWEARYFMLFSLINEVDNVGVKGLVIDMYKGFLHEVRNKSNMKYFIGKNLHQFLRKALLLKDGVKTDILENFHKIISGLNLFRYLILADSKDDSFTEVYEMVEEIKTNYLQPLQLAIDISKAHYQLEVKNVAEEKSVKKSNLNATLTVDGEVLPNLTPDSKKGILENGLVSLDLIQSVLSRVHEILKQKTC